MKLDQKYFELLHAKEVEEASLSHIVIEDIESGQDLTKFDQYNSHRTLQKNSK